MTVQQMRSIAYLIGNVLVSAIYVAMVWSRLAGQPAVDPDDRAWWALAILIFIGVQIVARILLAIIVAILAAIASAIANGGEAKVEAVDLEDEMDKAINRKSSLLTYHCLMLGLVAGIVTQALGWPVMGLFLAIGTGMIVAGVVGDLANLVFYRRGF
jgi:hypothetical protein